MITQAEHIAAAIEADAVNMEPINPIQTSGIACECGAELFWDRNRYRGDGPFFCVLFCKNCGKTGFWNYMRKAFEWDK